MTTAAPSSAKHAPRSQQLPCDRPASLPNLMLPNLIWGRSGQVAAAAQADLYFLPIFIF
jgi:hypothetical protein